MTRLAHRPDLTELLDAPMPDRPTLAGNLRDIRLVNRALGFAAAVVREVAAVTAQIGRADWTLLDVATGSADIPLAIVRWARRRGLRPRLLAGDLSPAVLAAARGHVMSDEGRVLSDEGLRPHAPHHSSLITHHSIALLRFDALHAPFADRGVDVVTCSLALHHFAPEDAVALLRELGRIAGRALIVSDLERCVPGYLGARLLAAVLRNRMTHHDAPVSVLRAYTVEEVRRLAADAGLANARVAHRFPFRLVLVWEVAD
jgi:ubiquinone/menaquinone biosynthesis C-methylase UbiE